LPGFPRRTPRPSSAPDTGFCAPGGVCVGVATQFLSLQSFGKSVAAHTDLAASSANGSERTALCVAPYASDRRPTTRREQRRWCLVACSSWLSSLEAPLCGPRSLGRT